MRRDVAGCVVHAVGPDHGIQEAGVLHSGIASTQNAATAAANECTSSTKCKEVDEYVWRKATPHAAHYIVGRSLAYGATAPSRPVNSADTFPPRTDPSHFRSDPAHNVSIFAQN